MRLKNIKRPCQIVLAVNPKEYFEYFCDERVNKKHKEIKKGSRGMDFENFTSRIASLNEIKSLRNPSIQFQEQQRFKIRGGEMEKTSIVKSKFSQTNNKRFYFENGIVSLTSFQPSLKNLNGFKDQKGQKIEQYLLEGKRNLPRLEKEPFFDNK